MSDRDIRTYLDGPRIIEVIFSRSLARHGCSNNVWRGCRAYRLLGCQPCSLLFNPAYTEERTKGILRFRDVYVHKYLYQGVGEDTERLLEAFLVFGVIRAPDTLVHRYGKKAYMAYFSFTRLRPLVALRRSRCHVRT